MASGLITDYIARGLAADRPATPVLYTGSIGFWYSTDTAELSLWDGAAWIEDIAGGGGGGGAVDSVNGQTGAVVLDAGDVGAATAAQGAFADTAVQPGDLAAVATTGDVGDLDGFPGGTTDFLRADGTFATPAGGGGSETFDLVTEASAFTADPATHSGRGVIILAGGDVTFATGQGYAAGQLYQVYATADIELVAGSGITLTPGALGTLAMTTGMAASVLMTSATAGVVIGQTVAAE